VIRIDLFYGMQAGTTQTIADQIQTKIGGNSVVNLHDISHADTQDFNRYECLIIGCPT